MFVSLPASGLVSALFFGSSIGLLFLCIRFFGRFLPEDRGRELAFEGEKSKGKRTSTGIVFVSFAVLFANLIFRLSLEIRLYSIAILLEMFAGFFDDNAKKPWSEGVKGLLDLLVAVFIALVYTSFNSNAVRVAVLGVTWFLPVPILFVLIVILVLVSINVSNITDGVDGLSATLVISSLLGFLALGADSMQAIRPLVLSFLAGLMVYLFFNASPSSHLMGDAGSRAMGTILALAALKSGSPFLFVPFACVIIIDGGASLIKLSVRRYLGRKHFMQNIRTPLHDHVRKSLSWSDAKTVARFLVLQAGVIVFTLLLIGGR